jgi:hypothetical protein
VQLHGGLLTAFRNKWPNSQAALYRFLIKTALPYGRLQDIIDYRILPDAHADAHAPEVLVERWAVISFRPLCPPSPPSSFSREIPGGKSSCHAPQEPARLIW